MRLDPGKESRRQAVIQHVGGEDVREVSGDEWRWWLYTRFCHVKEAYIALTHREVEDAKFDTVMSSLCLEDINKLQHFFRPRSRKVVIGSKLAMVFRLWESNGVLMDLIEDPREFVNATNRKIEGTSFMIPVVVSNVVAGMMLDICDRLGLPQFKDAIKNRDESVFKKIALHCEDEDLSKEIEEYSFEENGDVTMYVFKLENY